jgi:hypothetical protein
VNTLVFAQTTKEYSWACNKIRESKKMNGSIIWLGDTMDVPSRDEIPGNCSVYLPENLGLNSEEVWRDATSIEQEFWQVDQNSIENNLHITIQSSIAHTILHLVYAEALIKSAIERFRPNLILIPPAWTSKVVKYSLSNYSFNELQWHVYKLAQELNVAQKAHWSFHIKQQIMPPFSALGQLFGFIFIIYFDLIRTMKWLWSKVLDKKETYSEEMPGIVLANVDTDLSRQFNVTKLTEEKQRNSVAWLNLENTSKATEPYWQQIPLRDYLSEDSSRKRIPVPVTKTYKNRKRPTMLFPLMYKQSKIWYCSAIPLNGEEKVKPHLFAQKGMAAERFLIWRKLLDAGIRYCLACDVFKHIKPGLLVLGDTIDVHRFFAIAARKSEVPTLASSHGIAMWYEPSVLTRRYPLACVNSIFSHTSTQLSVKTLQVMPAVFIECHDSLDLTVSEVERGIKKKRVLIVVSAFSFSASTLTVGLFVKRDRYREELYRLVDELCKDPEIEIIIKSHPLSGHDEFSIYDDLQTRFKNVIKHWREPLKSWERIDADLAIFYNCASTLYFSVHKWGIPVLGHWGALSSLSVRLLGTSRLHGSSDSVELARIVTTILSTTNSEDEREAFRKSGEVYQTFVAPSEGGLNEAMDKAMQRVETLSEETAILYQLAKEA